jgi:AcrR family transcriptional regulator
MSRRPYDSSGRTAAALRTRQRLVAVAADLLRGEAGAAGLSMEAVARAAAVTRLTVYKQFGSRRGLLEAVFDDRAEKGGLRRIPEAMALDDPQAALDRIIEIFCDFWSSDPALGRVHDAAAVDAELRQAILERNEKRRGLLAALLQRLRPLPPGEAERRGTVDLLFTLTSLPSYRSLRVGRDEKETCDLIRAAASAIVSAEERHNSAISRDYS